MKAMLGVVLAAVLGCVLAIGVGLSARAQDKPSPDDQEKAKEKARVDAIKKKQAAMDRSLMADWPQGDVEKLRDMDAGEIVKIQIFAADWPDHVIDPKRPHVKRALEQPFTTEKHRDLVASFLAMLGRAKPWKPARAAGTRIDRVLVVQPVEGEPFEFLYSAESNAPFAGLGSVELKEALYALSGGPSRVTIIWLEDGKVRGTLTQELIAPQQGGVFSATLSARLTLMPANGLALSIKLRSGGQVIVDDEQPMSYDQAKVFPSKDKATTIVLLRRP